MKERILELLEAKKYPEIAAMVKDMNPADAAVLLEELPQSNMPIVFRLLPKELAADAFAYMDGDTQEVLIQGFTDKELDEVMEEMFLDDTVDMIEEMPANVVKRILRHVDEETRKMINQVLNYPKDSAGSIIDFAFGTGHICFTACLCDNFVIFVNNTGYNVCSAQINSERCV